MMPVRQEPVREAARMYLQMGCLFTGREIVGDLIAALYMRLIDQFWQAEVELYTQTENRLGASAILLLAADL